MANWRNAGHAWQIVNSCELPMLISSDWKIKLPASARAARMNEWMNDLVHWPSARLSVCLSVCSSVCLSWGTPTKLLHASVIFLWLVSCVQSVLWPLELRFLLYWLPFSTMLRCLPDFESPWDHDLTNCRYIIWFANCRFVELYSLKPNNCNYLRQLSVGCFSLTYLIKGHEVKHKRNTAQHCATEYSLQRYQISLQLIEQLLSFVFSYSNKLSLT